MDYKQKAIDHFSRDRFSIETTGVKIEKVEENRKKYDSIS